MLPGYSSGYAGYSDHVYGDTSGSHEDLMALYAPLLTVIFQAMVFSLLLAGLKGAFYVAQDVVKGKFQHKLSLLLQYRRNKTEVCTNVPFRARAFIRSLRITEYSVTNTSYIRPFVYLEQNYHNDSSHYAFELNGKRYEKELTIRFYIKRHI